jgi:hypothetical protein
MSLGSGMPADNRRASAGSYGGTRSVPAPSFGHVHPPSAEPADDFLSQYLAATMTKVSSPADGQHGSRTTRQDEDHSGRHQHPQQQTARIPRPHSADFLEYERSHPMMAQAQSHISQSVAATATGYGGQKAAHQVPRRGGAAQPPRPKSSIGELRSRQPDDFWSEEVYAQKMRESAYAYDPAAAAGGRSQSRAGSVHRQQQPSRGPPAAGGQEHAATYHEDHRYQQQQGDRFSNAGSEVRHNLSSGSGGGEGGQPPFLGHGQLAPPPAFYQDRAPWEEENTSPRAAPLPFQDQLDNQGQSPRGPYYSPQQLQQIQQQQLKEQHQQLNSSVSSQTNVIRPNSSFSQDQSTATATASQYFTHNNSNSSQQRVPIPQFSPNPQHYQHSRVHEQQQYLQQQQQQQQQQQVLLRQPQMSPNQMTMLNGQRRPQQPPPQEKIGSAVAQSADMTAVASPSYPPQPTPRKINTAAQYTPTTYQNVPHNSKAYSDPRPLASTSRWETATPNRLSERFDSDRSADSQLSDQFRRSASARLHKQKNRGGGDYGAAGGMQDESDDSKRNSDQVRLCFNKVHTFRCV